MLNNATPIKPPTVKTMPPPPMMKSFNSKIPPPPILNKIGSKQTKQITIEETESINSKNSMPKQKVKQV